MKRKRLTKTTLEYTVLKHLVGVVEGRISGITCDLIKV